MDDAQARVNMGGGWTGRFATRRPSALGLAFRIAAVLMVPPLLVVGLAAAIICVVLVLAFILLFLVALIIAPIALMISRIFSPNAPAVSPPPAPAFTPGASGEPGDDGRRNVRVITDQPADDT